MSYEKEIKIKNQKKLEKVLVDIFQHTGYILKAKSREILFDLIFSFYEEEYCWDLTCYGTNEGIRITKVIKEENELYSFDFSLSDFCPPF